MSEQPPVSEQEPKILSFEEFSKDQRYNNLYLYFVAGRASEIHRKNAPYYDQFAQENPELVADICDKIQNKRDRRLDPAESLRPFLRDLYEAYKIMRGYGASDVDLFR